MHGGKNVKANFRPYQRRHLTDGGLALRFDQRISAIHESNERTSWQLARPEQIRCNPG
jgi:hypothetical protein